MTCLPTPPENAPPPAVDGASDDYDSPWKEAVERYFPEFMAFYFPAAHVQIDWTQGYAFLDQELRAVVKDAELGKRFVDKLARVTRLSGEEGWVYIHIEVQASAQTEFAERMFVYNYRLYDRYRRLTLPPHLARSLWHNVEVLEEKQKMRYVTSIERLIIEQTRQQGMQQGKLEGEALALQRLLTKRFGRIPSAIAEQIAAAQQPQVEAWFDAAIDAPNLDTIFGPTQH